MSEAAHWSDFLVALLDAWVPLVEILR